MKEFCQSHNIPTAKSQTFVDFDEAKNYLESFNGPIVVKYDGLAAGKGVFVCTNTNEAIEACERIFIKKNLIKKTIKLLLKNSLRKRIEFFYNY